MSSIRGGPPAWLMRNRYSGAPITGTGPTSATLLAPGVAPPLAASVNSQALPETSAASAVACEAAFSWACAREGSVSMRQ